MHSNWSSLKYSLGTITSEENMKSSRLLTLLPIVCRLVPLNQNFSVKLYSLT